VRLVRTSDKLNVQSEDIGTSRVINGDLNTGKHGIHRRSRCTVTQVASNLGGRLVTGRSGKVIVGTVAVGHSCTRGILAINFACLHALSTSGRAGTIWTDEPGVNLLDRELHDALRGTSLVGVKHQRVTSSISRNVLNGMGSNCGRGRIEGDGTWGTGLIEGGTGTREVIKRRHNIAEGSISGLDGAGDGTDIASSDRGLVVNQSDSDRTLANVTSEIRTFASHSVGTQSKDIVGRLVTADGDLVCGSLIIRPGRSRPSREGGTGVVGILQSIE